MKTLITFLYADPLDDIKDAGGAAGPLDAINDPSSKKGPPEGIADVGQINQALDLIGWAAAIGAVFILAIIGLKIMTARAGHSPENAAKALGSLPWILGGMLLVYSAKSIVSAVL